jgi:4-diphosphocytidyl-2-C-methyl-D-erythritol kinase
MVLNSHAKINLTLSINKKFKKGLHNLQSIYCLVNLNDRIIIKKINKKKDEISFTGPFSKFVSSSNNSVLKVLKSMRNNKLIHDFYSVKIYKKIPVFAGFGGGSSNASIVMKYLIKKKIKEKLLNKIINYVGSDLRLFVYNQGFLKSINKVEKLKKKQTLFFLLVYPKVKCSTKEVFSKVKKFSKKKFLLQNNLKLKNKFINEIKNSQNDLQSIVEKKYPIIRDILTNISHLEGCYFSRMTGSGSACYGLFNNKKSTKVALKIIRNKYPKFWSSVAKTI